MSPRGSQLPPWSSLQGCGTQPVDVYMWVEQLMGLHGATAPCHKRVDGGREEDGIRLALISWLAFSSVNFLLCRMRGTCREFGLDISHFSVYGLSWKTSLILKLLLEFSLFQRSLFWHLPCFSATNSAGLYQLITDGSGRFACDTATDCLIFPFSSNRNASESSSKI